MRRGLPVRPSSGVLPAETGAQYTVLTGLRAAEDDRSEFFAEQFESVYVFVGQTRSAVQSSTQLRTMGMSTRW